MAQTYKPGEEVKISGVYRVAHDAHHVGEHDVTCVLGNKFPPCNYCGQHVRFLLARPAQDIEHDPNFKQPNAF